MSEAFSYRNPNLDEGHGDLGPAVGASEGAREGVARGAALELEEALQRRRAGVRPAGQGHGEGVGARPPAHERDLPQRPRTRGPARGARDAGALEDEVEGHAVDAEERHDEADGEAKARRARRVRRVRRVEERGLGPRQLLRIGRNKIKPRRAKVAYI